MKFSTAFLTAAAVAASVVARPSTLVQRLKSRQEGISPGSRLDKFEGGTTDIDVLDAVGEKQVSWSNNWAGVVLDPPSSGYYTSVTGRFTVPIPKHVGKASDQFSNAWVGIDGDASCAGGPLQAGVNFIINKHGVVSYEAWVELYPHPSVLLDNFDVRAGHVIQVDIAARSAIAGTATITNLNTKKSVSRTLTIAKDYPLCRTSAEWIVEDYHIPGYGAYVPFNNFGNVTFTSASAQLNTGVKKDLTQPHVVWSIMKDVPVTDITIHSGSSLSVVYIVPKKHN
ncbi:hypothetical protein ACEQ8H_007880 [Pleosporales sp. CAS-2024a]